MVWQGIAALMLEGIGMLMARVPVQLMQREVTDSIEAPNWNAVRHLAGRHLEALSLAPSSLEGRLLPPVVMLRQPC